MSEEEKYTLELTREEIDSLIEFLGQPSSITGADKKRLDPIIGKITSRLAEMRARTILKR